MRRILSLLALPLVAAGCSITAVPPAPCLSSDAICFDLRINGRAVQRLSDRAKLEQYESNLDVDGRVDLARVEWEIVEPIEGDVAMQVVYNVPGSGWFGERAAPELIITPLERQALDKSLVEQAVQEAARGAPSSSRAAPDARKLPAGAYLFKVTLWGEANWDRKYILVTVAE